MFIPCGYDHHGCAVPSCTAAYTRSRNRFACAAVSVCVGWLSTSRSSTFFWHGSSPIAAEEAELRARPQPERPAVTRTERSAPAWDWSGWRLVGMRPTATPPPRCGRAVDEAVARARPLSPGSEASVTGRHRGGSERDAYDSR